MEDINGAVVSYPLHAAERVTHAAANSATAAAATSEALSDHWCSSPQQGMEKRQTQGIPVVDLPEQHHLHQGFPDFWQNEQQRKRRGIVSHVPQRRHSAFECVYEHQQLRSPLQQRSQQRPSQDNSSPAQLESTQQPRQQQTCVSYTQPMQRRLPPSLPHQHLCKVAPLPESAVRRSAPLRCNSSAREATGVPDPPQHSNGEANSRNLSGSDTSTSSSGLGGCRLNNNSSQSTYNSSPSGAGPFKGSNWRGPNHGEKNPPEWCTIASARTTTYSSRPLLRVSARLDTLRSWPSAASPLEKADASAAYQTDAEPVEVEQAAAESAAAAAVRSAARAAAASAAARREAHAAAAESARAGSSPDQGKTAATHIETPRGTAAVVAEGTRVTAASRTSLVTTPPEVRMQKTREQVRRREGRDGCSTLSSSLLAAATASGDNRWESGEGVWAAEFVRTPTAGFLREEDTAVLTLSPELGQPTLPNVATAPAVVSTVLDVASACAAADDYHPESGLPCSTAAGTAACDASAGRRESVAAAASVDLCADVPALALVPRRSSEAVPVADFPASSHASAAVPSAAVRPTPGLCGAAVSVGAGDISSSALELPLVPTAEDEQGTCTPKSSCTRASPRSCCTSRSQEAEQQLHQKESEQSKEELQGEGNPPLYSEHGKQQTDENPLQQRPRQQQHVQQPQQQETPLQVKCNDLQDERQPSQRQQLNDGQRPHTEQRRRVPEQRQECHSLQEADYLRHDQVSASMPSECSGGAKAVSSHGVYAEKQPCDPQRVLPQLDTLENEQQQQPCSSRQPTQTDQENQEHLSSSQGQQSQVVQHEHHPPTPQNVKQVGTPRQEVQPETQQQQDGLHALHPEHRAEQRQGEQRAAHWNQEKKEESERQLQQQKHQQQSQEQQPLPQRRVQEEEAEVPERGDSICMHCDTEREKTSREHAVALRELQHVVQHQQEQLQQLMQQQTLLLQQLLQRPPPAGLLAGPNPGRERGVSELTHANAANSGAADSLPAGDAAAATVSQPPPLPPPAVLAPTTAAHHERGAAREPVAESARTVQVLNTSAAETGNTNRATSENSCSTQDSGAKKHEESDLRSSQQGMQQHRRTESKREVSQKGATQVQASTKQVNQPQQDRQCEALIGYELQKPTSLLQPAQEELQKQQMRQLFCVKQLLQDEQDFWGPSQQQTPCAQKEQPRRQHTMLQEEAPLRERQQHRLFEERPDMQQLRQKSVLRSTEERYSVSRSQLLQPATPPGLSPRVMLASLEQLPVVHRKACADPAPLSKISQGGPRKGNDATAVLATAGSASTAASLVAAAACAADAPTAAAHASATAQASILRPTPTTAAAGGEVEERAASVSHVLQQQRDVGVSPLPPQHQQQGRRRSTPADTYTPSYHTVPRDSSSSSSKERLLVEASLSRLSTDPGSQRQAHDHKEPWYPRSLVLEQHSMSGLDCRRDRNDARECLPSAAEVEFEKAEEAPAAAAMPALGAADERGRQHSFCTAELLRRQQWELQQKLRRLQERMQQLQQQQAALDPSLVLPQQEHATGADSPLRQQLPILLKNVSLQGEAKQQQHQEMPQRQKNAQYNFEDCLFVHQPHRWSSANNSGVPGLADSAGSPSSKDALRQRALSSVCVSGAAGTVCSPFTANALSEQSRMLAPASRSLHYSQLQLKKAPPHAMPAGAGGATNAAAAAVAASTGHPGAEDVFKTRAERFSAQAAAAPGRRSSATAPAEERAAFAFAGSTRAPLSPPSDSTLRLFPSCDSAARTPGDSRLAVAGPPLFVSATPVPADLPLAGAVAPSVHQHSANQRESENADRAPYISICYSLSDAPPGIGAAAPQLCSPGTAAAAAVKRTSQQEPLKQVRSSTPLHASAMGRKARGDDEGLEEGEEVPLPRPPLALSGLQKVLQQQDVFQDFRQGPAGVLPQQRHRRILDQDEQIVPSVLKRLLLQQQQQEGRGDRDGVGLFSSLALQHHNETCWWEEAASSRSPGKKQQHRRQGQLSRRLATSQKQQPQQQQRKRLGSSRSDGTVTSTVDARRRPSARLSGDCVARIAPARRQQAAQQKSERPSNPTLCSSALESWASSHGNRLSSSSSGSSHNIASKRNSNHVSRSGNSKRIISVSTSTRPTTEPSCCVNIAKENDHNDGPRAKGLQQRQCISRQDGGCESADLPSAALGTDFEQPRKKEAAKGGAILRPADSVSASSLAEIRRCTRPTSSEFLAGHGGAAGDLEAPASGSSAAGSQDSIPRKQVAEQFLAGESRNYDPQDCGTTDKSGSVFLLTPHDTSGSSRQHLRQQPGSSCDEKRQEARSRGDNSSGQQKERQRGELESPCAPRGARFFAADERKLTADNRSDVENISGESCHQLGRRKATLQPVESSGSPQAAERKSKSGCAPQPRSTTRDCAAAAAAGLLQSVPPCSLPSGADRPINISEEKSSEVPLYEEKPSAYPHAPPAHQQGMHAYQRQSEFSHLQHAASPAEQHANLPYKQQHTRSQAQQMSLEKQTPVGHNSNATLSSTSQGLLSNRGSLPSDKTNASAGSVSVRAAVDSEVGAAVLITAAATAEASLATTTRETEAALPDVSDASIAAKRSSPHQLNESPQAVTAAEHRTCLPQMQLQHQRGSERLTREPAALYSSTSHAAERPTRSPTASERLLRSSRSAHRLATTSYSSAAPPAMRNTLVPARTRQKTTAFTEGKAFPAGVSAASTSPECERTQQPSVAAMSPVTDAPSHSPSNSNSSSATVGINEEHVVADDKQQHSTQKDRQQRQKALQMVKFGAREAAEDETDTHSSSEVAAASAGQHSPLLSFLKIPQSRRQPRGQETAALVQIFLSQQEHFACAATARGAGGQRSTGTGIPYLLPNSRFCVEQLKHLHEDSAGDAHYVKTMAGLLQRYEALTNVD